MPRTETTGRCCSLPTPKPRNQGRRQKMTTKMKAKTGFILKTRITNTTSKANIAHQKSPPPGIGTTLATCLLPLYDNNTHLAGSGNSQGTQPLQHVGRKTDNDVNKNNDVLSETAELARLLRTGPSPTNRGTAPYQMTLSIFYYQHV